MLLAAPKHTHNKFWEKLIFMFRGSTLLIKFNCLWRNSWKQLFKHCLISLDISVPKLILIQHVLTEFGPGSEDIMESEAAIVSVFTGFIIQGPFPSWLNSIQVRTNLPMSFCFTHFASSPPHLPSKLFGSVAKSSCVIRQAFYITQRMERRIKRHNRILLSSHTKTRKY